MTPSSHEANLAKTKADNNTKANKSKELNQTLADAKVRHQKLNTSVKIARTQSANLKSALATGFEELEKTLNENSLDIL